MLDPWAIDFLRALNERPVIIKILLKPLFGRYAYREFIGLIENLGVDPFITGYELENQKYHNEDTPLKWWK